MQTLSLQSIYILFRKEKLNPNGAVFMQNSEQGFVQEANEHRDSFPATFSLSQTRTWLHNPMSQMTAVR